MRWILSESPLVPGFARADFMLDPRWTFLNHGSFGAVPRSVREEQARWMHDLERQPVAFLARRWWPLVAEAREAVARFLGTRPEDTAFVTNATAGVQAVVRSIDWQSGDTVVTTNHRYDAVHRILAFAMERCGGHVVQVDPGASPTAESLQQSILAAVNPSTRLVVLDAITSPTARAMPLDSLIGELQDRGHLVLVDGAHAPGQLEVQPAASAADFWVGNLHKWICAPRGAGVLVAREGHHSWLHAPITSHGHGLGLHAEFDWTGTFDPSAWLSAPRAIQQHLDWGGASLRFAHQQLAGRFRDQLCEALAVDTGQPPGSPHSLAMFAISLGVPDTHWRSGQALLAEHRIEAPLTAWRGETWLRVSAFAAYNTPADITPLVDILPELQRVLRDG
jgi:isopenicillin-N epimerase